ncbi:MAG: hypothetical protein JXQ72_02830 [Anaerolineae bacterium]|nr:hypothetical protein [Anaerolineae bacterium]
MTVENVQLGRVVQAIVMILVISFVIQIGIGVCYGAARVMQVLSDLDPDATEQEQEDRMREEIDSIMDEAADGSSTLNTLSILQWAFASAVTFFITLRTARFHATSPEQGTGYGLLTGLGVVILYGLCILGTPVAILVKLVFILLIVGAGIFGGQMGGSMGAPVRPLPPGYKPVRQGPDSPGGLPLAPGENPDTYYNMGVSAALGGRRDEARQHFTRVIQMQPRNIAAWLQLANLAEHPAQAWEYVQQARAVDPQDPAVMQAVDMIWPQVAAQRAGAGTAPPESGESERGEPDAE